MPADPDPADDRFDSDGGLRWRPAAGRAEQLMILLSGSDMPAAAWLPLAQVLRQAFPQAVLMAAAVESGADVAAAVPIIEDAALARLQDWVHAAQRDSGVGPAATALVGVSVGAMLALELVGREDGIAGRVLAFGGRYARLPEAAPRFTTIHLFHGADDAVVPVAFARAAIERLGALHGDATIDIAGATGHGLAPVLVDCALNRLRSHIPHRTWAAALGGAPPGRIDDDR
ncbi:dienelactone hydrolase family protein [Aquincola sp. S2]|uniref:Dienelactone hydrolase family protein n=2 Tax=Pseudaquabacterium terrae TaxID=2732868 RepID=A0ABX2EGR7_9BURK|nr:dienelactone hydrolase family protein [Aquabacterium terrae]